MPRNRPDANTITLVTSDSPEWTAPDPAMYVDSPFAVWMDPARPKDPLRDPPLPGWLALKTPSERAEIHRTCCEWRGLTRAQVRARVSDDLVVTPDARWFTLPDSSTMCHLTGRWRGGLIAAHGVARLPFIRHNCNAVLVVQREQDQAVKVAAHEIELHVWRVLGCLPPEPTIGGCGA